MTNYAFKDIYQGGDQYFIAGIMKDGVLQNYTSEGLQALINSEVSEQSKKELTKALSELNKIIGEIVWVKPKSS